MKPSIHRHRPSARHLKAHADLYAPRQHWHALTPEEQRQAIVRMHRDGYSDHGIAAATGLSVEMVRTVLADKVPE